MRAKAPHPPRTAGEVVETAHAALKGDRSSVGEITQAFGSRTPLLILPALALVSPLSGVPGFTSVCGMLIAAVSIQQMLHRPGLWLPGWMERTTLQTERARRFVHWFRKPARWLDHVTRRRLHALVTPPLSRLPQAISCVFGLAMPFLELVPFASSILGAIIVVMATGVFMGDGLVVLIGMMCAAFVAGGLVFML